VPRARNMWQRATCRIAVSGRCPSAGRSQRDLTPHSRHCGSAQGTSSWLLACKDGKLQAPISAKCPCKSSLASAALDWPESSRVCNDVFERYASAAPQPLTIEQVLSMRDPEETAAMLKQELPVRLANRIAHMNNLELIDECGILLCARARLVRSFMEVVAAAERGASPKDFAVVIRNLRDRHKHQVKRITMGTLQLKRLKLARGESESEVVDYIDSFIDRFVLSRIGIEALNSQYLGLFTTSKGIVDPLCDPCDVAKQAASHARRLALEHFEEVPQVEITFFGSSADRTIPLVSPYLSYILMELLKNSIRAVSEQHLIDESKVIHPIVIRVASDESQVVLDIFDRGGGIPFEHQPHIWSYMYSTKKRSPDDVSIDDEKRTPLAGFGVGLPLLRKYAEYLGGTVNLISMPKFGTHAFLFLQRCTSRKEGMPTYVNWLRKRDLQEKLLDFESRKRAAADVEDYAEALRLKGFASEVRDELSKLDQWSRGRLVSAAPATAI